MADDEKYFTPIVHREWRDTKPSLAAASSGGNEALLFEPVKRASDGSSAEAEALRDKALRNARSRRQLSTDDHDPKGLVGACDVVHLFADARRMIAGGAAFDRRGLGACCRGSHGEKCTGGEKPPQATPAQ